MKLERRPNNKKFLSGPHRSMYHRPKNVKIDSFLRRNRIGVSIHNVCIIIRSLSRSLQDRFVPVSRPL